VRQRGRREIWEREGDEGRERLQGTRESLQGRMSGVVMAKLYSFISWCSAVCPCFLTGIYNLI
jgi:hypothetical protein